MQGDLIFFFFNDKNRGKGEKREEEEQVSCGINVCSQEQCLNAGISLVKIYEVLGFPGGSVVKNLPANAEDIGSIPAPGRSHMPWSN